MDEKEEEMRIIVQETTIIKRGQSSCRSRSSRSASSTESSTSGGGRARGLEPWERGWSGEEVEAGARKTRQPASRMSSALVPNMGLRWFHSRSAGGSFCRSGGRCLCIHSPDSASSNCRSASRAASSPTDIFLRRARTTSEAVVKGETATVLKLRWRPRLRRTMLSAVKTRMETTAGAAATSRPRAAVGGGGGGGGTSGEGGVELEAAGGVGGEGGGGLHLGGDLHLHELGEGLGAGVVVAGPGGQHEGEDGGAVLGEDVRHGLELVGLGSHRPRVQRALPLGRLRQRPRQLFEERLHRRLVHHDEVVQRREPLPPRCHAERLLVGQTHQCS